MADFSKIEAQLSVLLMKLRDLLSESEEKEVRSFIDVGEYGLALETTVDILIEEKKRVSEEIVALIRELADAMSMDTESMIGQLR